ncbi:oligosaccharide flippase family protein [Pandoraea pnomenusa]|uniref:oligosaccharide flippase family protein n=1 Tax=Pandoraea pnomenusa TaxID=93220 RepID=UPI00333FB9C7
MNLIARNIAYLYVIQVLRLCLPLAMLSVLTRVLTEVQYSVYLYTLASAAWLSVFVEYGFNISATRRIAGTKDPAENRVVIVQTQSAKWMLAGVSLIFVVWALTLSSVFGPYPEWAACAWLLGAMTGITPTYYFQALSRLRIVALLEVMGGALTFGFVLVFVRHGEDFSMLAAVLVVVRFLVWQVLERRMITDERVRYRDIFTVRPGLVALKDGLRIFLVQGAASLYTSFNVVLLGGVSTAYAVAVYGSCERLVRAGLTFIGQATSAIFPWLNGLKATSPQQLDRMRRLVLFAFFAVSVAVLPVVYFLAPLISTLLFHDKLPDIAYVLRIMSLVIPAIAVSNVLAMHYLVVDRRERTLNIVVFSAVPINLVAGYYLSLKYGATGMAATWVVIEWLITLSLATIIFFRVRSPETDR